MKKKQKKRDLFTELVEGFEEIRAYEAGKITLRQHRIEPMTPEVTPAKPTIDASS